MNQQIILLKQTKDFLFENIHNKGYRIYQPYKNLPYLLTLCRRIWFKLRLPFSSIWFDHSLKNLDTDLIIIYEPLIDYSFLRWIKKNNKNTRIIFFYLNLVKTSLNPEKIGHWAEMWSWDKGDCARFNLKYNAGSGYIPLLLEDRGVKKYDIVFVGRDKGRYEQLLKLKKLLDSKHLKTYFHITSNYRYQSDKGKNYKKELSYTDNVKLELTSKAILDFVQDGQVGTTYRTMESIHYALKLITNNRSLRQYPFYNKNNIFILGEDSFDDLTEFLESPYQKISSEILEYFSFEKWLSRFNESADYAD